MTKLSFADISYQDGLKLLYLRKQALDNNQLPRLTKQAMAASDLFSNISANFDKKALSLQEVIDKLRDVVKNNENLSSLKDTVSQKYNALPEEAKRGLIGAGIGGGAGSIASTLFGNRSRNALNRALSGGVGGAALGGGIGLASVGAQELTDKPKGSGTAPAAISDEVKKRQEELVKQLDTTDVPTAVKEKALSTALNVPDTGTVFPASDFGTYDMPTPWRLNNPTTPIPVSTPAITNNSLKATAGGSAAGAAAFPVLGKLLSKIETNKSPEAIQAAVNSQLLNKLVDKSNDYAGEAVQRQLQSLSSIVNKNRKPNFDFFHPETWQMVRDSNKNMSTYITEKGLKPNLTAKNLKNPAVQEWVQANVPKEFNVKRPNAASRYLSGGKGAARGGLLGGLVGLTGQLYSDNTARRDADQAYIDAMAYPNK
jgi:hypothetical protein